MEYRLKARALEVFLSTVIVGLCGVVGMPGADVRASTINEYAGKSVTEPDNSPYQFPRQFESEMPYDVDTDALRGLSTSPDKVEPP